MKKKSYEISFCGRFEEVKGVITLLSVFDEILSEKLQSINNDKVVLNMIGDGSLKDEITKIINRLKISNHVRLYSKDRKSVV